MAVKHGIDIDELLDGGMMDRSRIRARSRLVDSVDSKDGVEVASIAVSYTHLRAHETPEHRGVPHLL